MAKLRVFLWAVANPIIVVPAPTEVVYCNQVEGSATARRELEGFLLPLPRLAGRVFDPSWGRKHQRMWSSDKASLFDEIEQAFGALLSAGEIARDVRGDRAADDVEAWVNVSFTFPLLSREGDDDGSRPMRGVLTWESSD